MQSHLFLFLVYRRKIYMKFNGWLFSFLALPEIIEQMLHHLQRGRIQVIYAGPNTSRRNKLHAVHGG